MSTQMSFTVSGVRNPRSIKSIANQFAVSTFTQEGYAIDKGTMQASDSSDLTLEPAFFTAVSLEEPDSLSE